MTTREPHPPPKLVALLGPPGPEIGCKECFAVVDRYVELELSGDDADREFAGMRAHLAGCPACADEYLSLRELLAREG